MTIASDRLDQVLTQWEAGRSADSLQTAADPELRPLLEAAAAIRGIRHSAPSAAALERTLRAVQSAGARERAAGRSVSSTVGRRWMAAGAIALLVLAASGGSVFAADSALPDSPLYPVRVAHEHAEIALAGSAPRRAARYGDFAVRRADQLPNAKRELSDRALIVALNDIRDLLGHATREAHGARDAGPVVKTAAAKVRRDLEELERQPLRPAVAAAAAQAIREAAQAIRQVEDDEPELGDD